MPSVFLCCISSLSENCLSTYSKAKVNSFIINNYLILDSSVYFPDKTVDFNNVRRDKTDTWCHFRCITTDHYVVKNCLTVSLTLASWGSSWCLEGWLCSSRHWECLWTNRKSFLNRQLSRCQLWRNSSYWFQRSPVAKSTKHPRWETTSCSLTSLFV